MKVTDTTKLTYPCYLKDPIDGMIIKAVGFTYDCNGYIGYVTSLGSYVGNDIKLDEYRDGSGSDNVFAVKFFCILCDKDGNEIDLQEQKSVEEMTIEAAQQKIAELQAFIEKKKEESKLYSADELINSNGVLEGLYRSTAGSFVIVDEAGYAMWISAEFGSMQSLRGDDFPAWKRIKKFKIEVID